MTDIPVDRPVTVQDFSKDLPQPYSDARLEAPAFHRNQQPIRSALKPLLFDKSGHAVEIGSGTGQHIIHFAEDHPGLTWWPSDLNDTHIASIDAWRQTKGGDNIMPPVKIDASQSDWGFGEPNLPPKENIHSVISLNVIHIAPWDVAVGLFRGAAHLLSQNGMLILYGPFSINGQHTAESNERFDKSLRDRNKNWGVRDTAELEALAENNRLTTRDKIEMPSNNMMLVFEKRGE